MERERPRTSCCGIPVEWVRCDYWEDEIWEGECVWFKREFAYFDAVRSDEFGIEA